MGSGVSVALMLFVQGVSTSSGSGVADTAYGPAPSAAHTSSWAGPGERECVNQNKDPNGREIVICAIKPEGYRLPPDIVEARRLKKEGIIPRPRSPHETYANHSCAHVGPTGCAGTPAINLLAVATTAAEISKRLANGQEIGSLLEAQKSSTDYQLYQIAKKSREEKEAAAAAKAVKEKAQAAAKGSIATSAGN